MSESVIREIAQQIIQEQLLQNWGFYLVLLALMFLSSVASGFIISFFRKRAETYATKADLAELLDQLRATTEAAEQVRTAIAHSDWATKEWKTLRRVKLEELLGTVYALREWLDKEMNIRFFAEKSDTGSCPIWKIELISRLYFPELRAEIQVLTAHHWQYTLWMIDVQKRLSNTGNDLVARQAIFDSMMVEVKPHHEKLLGATTAIEEKAPDVMEKIVAA